MKHKHTELEEYELELKNHDWYYAYSDDYIVWQKGHRNYNYLREKSTINLDFEALFHKYSSKYAEND